MEYEKAVCRECGHIELDQHDTIDRMKRLELTGTAYEVVSHLFLRLNVLREQLEAAKQQRDKAVLDLASLQQVVLNRGSE
jgi:hypothetical protein